jgi:hypothetical protein
MTGLKMSETSTKVAPKMPSAEEVALIKKFLNDTTLFLGPDPEIMQNHDLMPRSAEEDAAMKNISDAHTVAKIRDRIQAGCDEGYEMVEQMGAAPGAKWGDIITGVYSASGDLAIASAGGVLIFSALVHPPDQVHHQELGERADGGRTRRRRLHPQRLALRQRPQHRPVDDPAHLPQGQAGVLGGVHRA